MTKFIICNNERIEADSLEGKIIQLIVNGVENEAGSIIELSRTEIFSMTKIFYSTPLPEAKHEAAEKSDVAALRQYAIDAMNSIDKKKEKEQLKILYDSALISHEDFLEMTTDGNIKFIDTRNMTTEEKDKLMREIRSVPQIAYDLLHLLDD